MGMRYPELSIVTRKRDLKERRDLVRRYLRAYVDAVRTMKSNREMTVRVIEKYIHVGSKMEANKTYDYFARSIFGDLTDRTRGDYRISCDPGAEGSRRDEAKSQRFHR